MTILFWNHLSDLLETMRKLAQSIAPVFVLFVLLAVIAACTGKRDTTEVLSPDEPPAQESEKAFELQRAEEPVKKTGDPIIVQASHPMIPFGIGDRIMPDDFEIGSLQDTIAPDGRDAAVLEILVDFAEKLLKHEIHADSFDEDKKMLLRNSLQYYVEKNMMPDDIRFGMIRYDTPGNGYLSVRLLTKNGRSTGEIFIGRRDDRWFITDLQLDLRTLAKEYEPGKEKYVPSRYSSVLKLF
jgi:hypothetical protein